MLLSDQQLQAAMESGDLVIMPKPLDEQFQPASIDLRIDPKVRKFKDNVNVASMTLNINTLNVEVFLNDNTEVVDISQTPLRMEPGEFVIARTLETVHLSNVLSGRVEGRSRLARMGVGVHITAPKIDPGFRNYITLEMFHLGRYRIEVPNEMAICTLLVEDIGSPAERPYHGSFQGVDLDNP